MNLHTQAFRSFRGSGGDGNHFIGSSHALSSSSSAAAGPGLGPASQHAPQQQQRHGLHHQPQYPVAGSHAPPPPAIRSSQQQQQQQQQSPPHQQQLSHEDRNQVIFRKVRGILNKLTPEKFDKLGEQLISLRLDSIPVLKGVILLIFEKAIEEPKYSSMYAQLCKKLSRELNSIPDPSDQHNNNSSSSSNHNNQNSSNSNSSSTETNTFCRLLLIKCRDEFDNRLKATERFREKLHSPSFAGAPSHNGSSGIGGGGGQQYGGPHGAGAGPSVGPVGSNRPRPVLTNLSSLAVGGGRPMRQQQQHQHHGSSLGPVGGPVPSHQLQQQHQRKRLSDEEEEAWSLAKSKMLGNMRFICELGRQGLVQENILHVCIKQLVSKRKDETIGSKSEDLECLCQIMKTVGRLLDTDKARKLMDQYFERIVFYATCRELPSRIRFMLKDVIELRDTRWQPRRVARENGPLRIGQIREEAAKDLGIDPMSLWDNGTGMLMMAPPGSGGGGGPGGMMGHRNSGAMPGYLNGMMMPPGGPSAGSGGNNFSPLSPYPMSGGGGGSSLSGSSGRLPLYGHPANPLVMNPGQRALDDMGYYANFGSGSFLGTGPGAIREDRHGSAGGGGGGQRRNQNQGSAGIGLNTGSGGSGGGTDRHVLGHMPYRGSSSQDDPRKRMDHRADGGAGGGGARNHSQDSAGGMGHGHLPPRMMSGGSQGLQSSSQQSSLPANQMSMGHGRMMPGGPSGPASSASSSILPIVPKMPPIESISLRPAQNSMVLKPMALAAAANASRHLGQGSSGKSSPVSESGSTAAAANGKRGAAAAAAAVSGNSKQDLLKKVTEVMEELVSEAGNMATALGKMRDLKIPKNFQQDVLLTLMKGCLPKSDRERVLLLKLVNSMRQQNMLSPAVFPKALHSLLTQLQALEVDDPLIKTHASEFAAAFVANKTLSLKDACDLVIERFPMFLLLLQHLHTLVGQKELKLLFDASKINLMTVLPPDDRKKDTLSHILEKRSLSFLQPLLSIQLQLEQELQQQQQQADAVDAAKLLSWIKDHVDENLVSTRDFVIVLYTCVVRHIMRTAAAAATTADVAPEAGATGDAKAVAEAEKEAIRSYRPLLTAFVAKSASLQLAALYAVQSVCHDLSFPKGMILRWFNNLYDQEVIDEEVFLRWKEDLNDEFPGKGQALFQVNAWLIWLETEADSDDEDDEQEDEDPDSLTRK